MKPRCLHDPSTRAGGNPASFSLTGVRPVFLGDGVILGVSAQRYPSHFPEKDKRAYPFLVHRSAVTQRRGASLMSARAQTCPQMNRSTSAATTALRLLISATSSALRSHLLHFHSTSVSLRRGVITFRQIVRTKFLGGNSFAGDPDGSEGPVD